MGCRDGIYPLSVLKSLITIEKSPRYGKRYRRGALRSDDGIGGMDSGKDAEGIEDRRSGAVIHYARTGRGARVYVDSTGNRPHGAGLGSRDADALRPRPRAGGQESHYGGEKDGDGLSHGSPYQDSTVKAL